MKEKLNSLCFVLFFFFVPSIRRANRQFLVLVLRKYLCVKYRICLACFSVLHSDSMSDLINSRIHILCGRRMHGENDGKTIQQFICIFVFKTNAYVRSVRFIRPCPKVRMPLVYITHFFAGTNFWRLTRNIFVYFVLVFIISGRSTQTVAKVWAVYLVMIISYIVTFYWKSTHRKMIIYYCLFTRFWPRSLLNLYTNEILFWETFDS